MISFGNGELAPTTPPDLYLKRESEFSSLSAAALQPLRTCRVNIYVSFGSRKLNVPLSCKVSEGRLALEDIPRSSMIWEYLWSPRTVKNCMQKENLASCCMPGSYMPSTEVLLEWAVNSVQRLPSGVVKDLYGPLYTFAANYIRIGSRPLVSQQMFLSFISQSSGQA